MYLTGMYTALITPFRGDEVDLEGVRTLIRRQIAAGVDGVLLLGSTGEHSTLSREECEQIVRIGVEECKGRVTLMVGTGSNCTRTTIEQSLWAEDLGADILLIVTPYYNRPTQKGLYCHFEAVARAVSTPIILYNNPARALVSVDPLTLCEIAELPNMVAVKDCTNNLSWTSDVIHHLGNRSTSFTLVSGDDIAALPIMAVGGQGLISILSNLLPERMVALVRAIDRGEMAEARRLHNELLPLFKATCFEPNPIPIKEAMAICGLPSGGCRLPLTGMSEPHRESLHRLLQEAGLIPASRR